MKNYNKIINQILELQSQNKLLDAYKAHFEAEGYDELSKSLESVEYVENSVEMFGQPMCITVFKGNGKN